MKTNFSQISCNMTFKNILRNEDINTIKRDSLIAPVTDVKNLKFSSRREAKSQDDIDIIKKESEKLKKKYEKNYLNSNGALRVTLNQPEENKKKISVERRDQVQSDVKNNNEYSPTKAKCDKLVKDFYTTNPIEIFNNQKFNENVVNLRTKNKVKCDRVSDYLGSGGVKSIFSYSSGKFHQDNSKITNREAILANNNNKEEKNHEFKRFNHYFEGKKGCFMK